MNFVHRVRRASAVVTASAFVAFATLGHAQEISNSHLAAARTAIDAINVTDLYDSIIPQAAQALMQELILQNPDLQELIINTVREKAIGMAGRRADLEKEVALIYAKVFTEPELNELTAFYKTAAGQKLLANGPTVTRDMVKAVEIWQRGIARDLSVIVGKHLEQVVNVNAKAPAEGAAPAPDGAAPAPEAAAPAPEGAEVPAQ